MKPLAPAQTIPFLLLATLALCALLLYHAFRPSPPPSTHPLTTGVYVWQRNWSDDVRSAIRAHAHAFDRLVILARQISWDDAQPRLLRIPLDWDSLAAAHTPVGAAIRIAAYPGPFDGPSAEFLAQTIRGLRAEAQAHAVPLAEIQLDFDCSTAHLPGYRQWLLAAQPAAAEGGGIPLTITTLPAWLDSPNFPPLVHAADSFILQVHGIDKPRTLSDPLTLCDPAAARKAIAQAARVGQPFRVALPTYGYAAIFDAAGQFSSLAAEGAPPGWAGEGGGIQTLRLAEAQPAPLAALVAELTAAHPASLQGLIWYRLPIDSDRLNWRWPTLAAVMKGQNPAPAQLTVRIAKSAGHLADISLANTGQRDTDAPFRITIHWPSAALVAADALGDVQLTPDPEHHQLTLTAPGGFPTRLRPGDSRPIGWLKLSQDEELSTHVD